jgi:hypothetical protein
MLRSHEIPITHDRLPVPPTGFLDRLASELKIGRHAAYRHAVQRVLETVRKSYESGQYRSTTEAEYMLRKLVEQAQTSAIARI